METSENLSRAGTARVAHLASVGAAGPPHIVPITFAIEGRVLYFAIDDKPKRTTNLKRLRNIANNPAVSILVDHYEDDWEKLWWVRLDGSARIVTEPAEREHALDLLLERYVQYRRKRPDGPVVAVSIEHDTGWSGAQPPT